VGTTAFAGGSRLIGAPVPVWISTLGAVANFLLVVPVVIIALNLFGTFWGRFGALQSSITLRFILVSILGFVLASAFNLALSMRGFAQVAQFTLMADLRDWLIFYACFSTAMFGAAYFILPRLTGKEWRSTILVKTHFFMTAIGVVLLTAGLAVGGWQQGILLHDATVPFGDITKMLGFWFTFHSIGLIVLLIGHVAFLINFVWIACPLNSRGTPAAQFNNPPDLTLPSAAKATTEGHA